MSLNYTLTTSFAQLKHISVSLVLNQELTIFIRITDNDNNCLLCPVQIKLKLFCLR